MGVMVLDILPALKGEDSSAGQRAGPASPLATSRLSDGGPARQYQVRARYVGPARGVACCASIRTWYPLAPCIPFVSERRRGCPQSRVSPRSGTGRAIGLPALRVVREPLVLVITKDAQRLSNDHGGQAQASEGRFLPAVSPRPRRRPLGNGVVAFVVRADPNPTASFCSLCLPWHTLSGGLVPAVVAELSDLSPP